MSGELAHEELARVFYEELNSTPWESLGAEEKGRHYAASKRAMKRAGMRVEHRLNIKGKTRPLREHEAGTPLSDALKAAGAKIQRSIAAPWRAVDIAPVQFRCICTGQGGSVYSADCPLHDNAVDTDDPAWRRRYDGHLEAQRKIKERLGW